MKIDQKQFNEFEQDFLMEHLKCTDYRYGQAFLNTFRDIYHAIDASERARLWNEWDVDLARRHCLKWVEEA
jgi:hypothetical protein